MSELPNGWHFGTLADVAEILRGVTYRKSDARSQSGPGLTPLLRATNIGATLDLDGELVYVPSRGVKQQQFLLSGDVVLASSSGSLSVVGKSARLPVRWDGTFGAFCAVVRPTSAIDSRFLSLYLSSEPVRRRWSDAARGTNINNLKKSDLQTTPIPLPSLCEQRRIVDILEDHLSRLDAGAQMLLSAGSRAVTLRSSALEALLSDAAGTETTLGEIASWGSGGTPSARTKLFYESGSIPWANSGDLKDGVLTSVPGRITQEGFDRSATKWVPPGAVLVAMYGATIGRLAITSERMTTNQAVAHAITDSRVSANFLFWYLRSQRRALAAAGKGGAQPNISQSVLKAWPVRIPSLADQRRLTLRAKGLFEVIERLECEVQEAVGRLGRLKRALLAAAFAGRLSGRSSDMAMVEEMAGV